VSDESSLGGSEPGSPREGVSFPSAPLGLSVLPWHGGGDRGVVEGVKGGCGKKQDAVEGDGGAQAERSRMDVPGSQGAN
jgi:hypothetical protein